MKQILEIQRLPDPESQIALAKECSERDLSPKELKASVDKKLGNRTPKEGEETQKKDQPYRFSVKNGIMKIKAEFYTVTDIDQFLSKLRVEMMLWMSKHPSKEKNQTASKIIHEIEEKPIPPVAAELPKEIRLPKNEQEQAELEAASQKSPADLYRWIYGPESDLAKTVEGQTWQQLNVDDPIQSARRMVDGLRQLQHPEEAKT